MSVRLEDALRARAPAEWKLDQLIVLDWYDGPVEGLAALAEPCAYFHFKMFAERRPPSGLADRLFHVSELTPEAFERAREALQAIEPERRPIWVPPWVDVPESVGEVLQDVLNEGRRTELAILSKDMEHVERLLDVSHATSDPDRRPQATWFERLGLG